MSNPAKSYEINAAHDALEKLERMALKHTEYQEDKELCAYWKYLIHKALPENPTPTMANIEWDSDKHLFAEAEHPHYGKVMMLQNYENNYIGAIDVDNFNKKPRLFSAHYLTPTGYRYTRTKEEDA